MISNHNSLYKQILKKIKNSDEIVIARHIGPDPDALASQIALREIIKLNYPNKKIYAVGTNVARFKYIGALDKIDVNTLNKPLLIICDVPSFDRVDDVNCTSFQTIVKIDHHPYENKSCDIDFINEHATSTCEIIADMAHYLKLKLNDYIAKTLMIGIISDSERFLFKDTNPRTFELCSYLLGEFQFDMSEIYNSLYERPLNERLFEAYLLSNMTITENGFGYLNVPVEMTKKYNVDAGTPSNMVNNFNFIKELKAWAFASYDERAKLYRVNIRSRKIVINKVAEKYNGGGHVYASGARIESLDDVNNLFKDLDEECRKYNETSLH